MRYLVSFAALVLLSACVDGDNYNSFRSPTNDSPSVMTADPAMPVPDVASGEPLPFGAVAKACGVSRSQMGSVVASFPESRPVYTIYDTNPGSSKPRTLYITGFNDRCARQFTGSLALFGDVGIYEEIHYGAPAKTQKSSTTDLAYDQLKASVCGAAANAPCGNRIGKLERNTAFLSVYKNFGDNRQWVNMLLHDGEVLAVDEKSG